MCGIRNFTCTVVNREKKLFVASEQSHREFPNTGNSHLGIPRIVGIGMPGFLSPREFPQEFPGII